MYQSNSLPIDPHTGKLSSKALPLKKEVLRLEDGTQRQKGSSSTQTALIALWEEVLLMKILDIQESFFDLGGLVCDMKRSICEY